MKPTVGRVVWYRPNGSDSGVEILSDSTPVNAQICYVWSDTMVNLAIDDHNGNRHARTSVPLIGPDERIPAHGHGAYCEWMPYQIKVAKESGN